MMFLNKFFVGYRLIFVVTIFLLACLYIRPFLLSNNLSSFKNKNELVEELVDLSHDGHIQFLKEVSIDLAHSQNLLHRGTWNIILNPSMEKIAFFRRSKSHKTCGNSWNLIGEHTKIGESYEDACMRGLREELHIFDNDIKSIESISPPVRLHLHYPKVNRSDSQWTETFLVILKIENLHPDPAECSEHSWIPLSLAKEWISYCSPSPSPSGDNRTADPSDPSCRTCLDAVDIHSFSPLRTNFTTFADLIISRIELVEALVAARRAQG